MMQYSLLFPPPSTEVVQLTPEKRVHLLRLRAETKFQPNEYPPFFYTGAETPEDGARAAAAVNDVIDAVLAQSDHTRHGRSGENPRLHAGDLVILGFKRGDRALRIRRLRLLKTGWLW
jgi:hypothetical protein